MSRLSGIIVSLTASSLRNKIPLWIFHFFLKLRTRLFRKIEIFYSKFKKCNWSKSNEVNDFSSIFFYFLCLFSQSDFNNGRRYYDCTSGSGTVLEISTGIIQGWRCFTSTGWVLPASSSQYWAYTGMSFLKNEYLTRTGNQYWYSTDYYNSGLYK